MNMQTCRNGRRAKVLSFLLMGSALSGADSLVYEGEEGIGKGKHIVFLANDHEYRSEQSCPLMAKLLAKHHGFRCTVLFGLNEKGEIEPGAGSVPGLEALKDADLLFFFARFMNLPDEQVDLLADYFERGGPAVALRTSTHCFNGQEGKWSKFNFNYEGEDYAGGLGKQVFGNTWKKNTGQGHYGGNHRQGSRISPVEEAVGQVILSGVEEIHAYSGAYSSPVPSDAVSLLEVQVLETFEPSDEIASNKPPVTAGWMREVYTAPSGAQKNSRTVYTSFGASEDLLDEDARRFLLNSSLWAMGLEEQISPSLNVEIVGTYHCSPYTTGALFFSGVKPADLVGWESAIMPENAKLAGVDSEGGKNQKRIERVFKNRPQLAKKLLPIKSDSIEE